MSGHPQKSKPGTIERAQPHAPPLCWLVPSMPQHETEGKIHKRDVKKDVESSKTVISFDFGYTYVDDYGNEKSPEEVKDADEQYGTVLHIADHHTKAVHALPVLSKGAPNLKLMVEELVRFENAGCWRRPLDLSERRERSTKQLLRAVQHCRANLGLETEIRISGVQQHASNGQERTVQSVRRLANCLRYYAEGQFRGECHVQTPHSLQGRAQVWQRNLGWQVDCNIVLTPGGAVEPRAVKRASGVLMKKIGPRRRIAAAADEAEENEKAELDNTEERREEKKAKEAGSSPAP